MPANDGLVGCATSQVGQQQKTRSRASIARTGISKVYPFAAAGINVTRVVAQVFGLVGPAGNKTPFENESKKFWPLVDELNELYCVVFKLMDKVLALCTNVRTYDSHRLRATKEGIRNEVCALAILLYYSSISFFLSLLHISHSLNVPPSPFAPPLNPLSHPFSFFVLRCGLRWTRTTCNSKG